MTAAEVAGVVIRGGLAEDAYAAAVVTPWIALAVFAGMAALRWYLGRQRRRVPLQPLPPEDDDLGDDAIEMLHGWDAEYERLVRREERRG